MLVDRASALVIMGEVENALRKVERWSNMASCEHVSQELACAHNGCPRLCERCRRAVAGQTDDVVNAALQAALRMHGAEACACRLPGVVKDLHGQARAQDVRRVEAKRLYEEVDHSLRASIIHEKKLPAIRGRIEVDR